MSRGAYTAYRSVIDLIAQENDPVDLFEDNPVDPVYQFISFWVGVDNDVYDVSVNSVYVDKDDVIAGVTHVALVTGGLADGDTYNIVQDPVPASIVYNSADLVTYTTAVSKAAELGKINIVRMLIDSLDPSADYSINDYQPYRLAVLGNHISVVNYFLGKQYLGPSLFTAVAAGDVAETISLIDQGAHVGHNDNACIKRAFANRRTRTAYDTYTYSAAYETIFDALAAADADPNVLSGLFLRTTARNACIDADDTASALAVRAAERAWVEKLLGIAGITVTHYNHAALRIAVVSGHATAVNLLLNAYTDYALNSSFVAMRVSLLKIACAEGYLTTAEHMFAQRASTNPVALSQTHMDTLLDVAASNGHSAVVNLLIGNGPASLNGSPTASPKASSHAALYSAANGGHVAVISAFLPLYNPAVTSDLDALNNAMSIAAKNNSAACVSAILAHAYPAPSTSVPALALYWANRNDNSAMAAAISGASSNAAALAAAARTVKP